MKRIIRSSVFLFIILLGSCTDTSRDNTSSIFLNQETLKWEDAGEGVKRQVLGYDNKIMLVRVDFIENGIGAEHQHHHSQSSFVLKGEFDVTVDGVTKTLREGDSFFVPSGAKHGAICKQAGSLLDAFSPAREDFLSGSK